MNYFRIRNWQKYFENHESRKLRSLAWLPVINKHDGRGYRRVAALPNSVQVFCAWSLIIQVASKMPTRGVLRDDDGALTASDLAFKTGYPQSIFESAFTVLTRPEIGWLEEVDEREEIPEVDAKSGIPPDTSRGVGTFPVEGKGTEGNRREGGNAPVEPPANWPKTEQQAVEWAGMPSCAVPPEFTRRKYNEAVGVGYADWKGKPITDFRAWLRSEYLRSEDGNARKGQGKKRSFI